MAVALKEELGKRTVVLLRASSKQQTDREHDFDIPQQKSILLPFVNSKGWDLVKVFTEGGVLGHINHHHFYFGRYYGYRRSGKKIESPKSNAINHGSGMSNGCACACAGGGRAGCSRKDFNNYLNI